MHTEMTTYDDNFIAQMKDYAVLGLYPPQIAERMGLKGEIRRRFLVNISDYEHPLAKEYWKARERHSEDLSAALATAAMTGDPKALTLAYQVEKQREIDALRLELFGI